MLLLNIDLYAQMSNESAIISVTSILPIFSSWPEESYGKLDSTSRLYDHFITICLLQQCLQLKIWLYPVRIKTTCRPLSRMQ